jgi:hypothetical protein
MVNLRPPTPSPCQRNSFATPVLSGLSLGHANFRGNGIVASTQDHPFLTFH